VIQKEKSIHIPDDILSKYLDKDGLAAFRAGTTGIFSITVFGRKSSAQTLKPLEIITEASGVCTPGSGCC